jgi:hypothetical protein
VAVQGRVAESGRDRDRFECSLEAVLAERSPGRVDERLTVAHDRDLQGAVVLLALSVATLVVLLPAL